MNQKILIPVLILIISVIGLLLFQSMSKKTQDTRSRASESSPDTLLEFSLDDKNNSSLTAVGTVTANKGKATVSFTLMSQNPLTETYHAQIRNGTCGEPGDLVLYPLSDTINATSQTILPVDYNTLEQQFPLIITVQSVSNDTQLVACGYLDKPIQ